MYLQIRRFVIGIILLLLFLGLKITRAIGIVLLILELIRLIILFSSKEIHMIMNFSGGFLEGPTLNEDENVIYFSDVLQKRINKLDIKTYLIHTFDKLDFNSNGLAYKKNNLYICDFFGKRLLKMDIKSKKLEELANNFDNYVNDIEILDDSIFTTDSRFFKKGGNLYVYKNNINKKIKTFDSLNGIAIKKPHMYLCDPLNSHIYKFIIESIDFKSVVKSINVKGDGITIDEYNNMYVCETNIYTGLYFGKLNKYDKNGKYICSYYFPEVATNVICVNCDLYVTGISSIYIIKN